VGIEYFCTKLPKPHPYAKSGRTNRLAYVAVTLIYVLYGDVREKKYARIAIGNSMLSITLRRYRAVVIIVKKPQRACINTIQSRIARNKTE